MWKALLMVEVPARLIILIIQVITSYDQLSGDAIIFGGLECAV